ncbi:YkvA family protein [Clostridium sp. 'White wine YQ']|uniref:YkvA family protein n=1 Tax=Clostridium sp. 'White wine YQ' TaxID=3027474 RepID=UPI0023662936|nr:YkvA family protein [Clostridium sp. 'White wine YQ']MDD7794669.1 YkvA family protein [Clostridium sp. 'White wine YQ']
MRKVINKLKSEASKMKKEVTALIIAYKRNDVPLIAKILAIIIVAYAVSPIDLIPDFIPVLGYLDDIILIPLGITLVLKLIPREIMEECREEAKKEIDKKSKIGMLGVILTLAVWAVVAFTIIKAYFK